jgi:hypothetical protein
VLVSHVSVAHHWHRWARKPGVKNEYFHLLKTLKDGTAKKTKKILTDIVNGQPGVLDNGATSKRPSKVRNQDFGCGCEWDAAKPVLAAQAASTATLSGPMPSSSA